MCLDITFNEEKKEKKLKKLPDVFTTYKIVYKENKNYFAFFREYNYVEGENIAQRPDPHSPYFLSSGFYSFKNYFAALLCFLTSVFSEGKRIFIIKCKVKKEDILQMGIDGGLLTIVSKKITIPKYKE